MTVDGVSADRALGPGKPLGLITYLALIPSRSATRDHLLDLFWSDLEPEAGRHALRQTLWYLKRRLGLTLLTSADETIALTFPVDSDRDAFIAAAESDDLERAVNLYTGDFLANFALPGGAEFEHWADLERERLRATFVRTAERLTRMWLSVPKPREAVALARRTRDTAPNSELAWRLVLEALISSRDHLGAIVEADALERRLRDDRSDPEPPTRALLRAARREPRDAERAARDEGTALTAELVGREVEFSRLLSAWTGARDGRAQRLHISGRPGIGKSRLMGDVEARLRARRARIASVRARPGDRHIPFALLAALAAALAEHSGANGVAPEVASTLVTLNPRLSSIFTAKVSQPRDADLVRTRSLAISELLAAVAEDGAVAVFVDDVHWADEESQRALGSALGRLSDEHVLAVTTSRPVFLPSFDLTAAEPVTLAPLTSVQVGALVASLGAVPESLAADDLAKRVQGATHGSPLLILELLGSLIERGTVSLENGEWRVHDHDALATTIMSGSAIYHRLAGLAAAEQRVILASALAGVPLETQTYARAVGTEAHLLEPLLNDLERRGFIARSNAGWHPAHDEIAEAIVDLSPLEERAHGHRKLARALAELRAQPVQLIRAARQFMIVDDEDSLSDVFSDWLAVERSKGDRRSAKRLASEFLGEDAHSDRVKRLAARAPFLVRHPFTAWYAAAAAVLLLSTAVLSMRPAPPPPPLPDAILLARTVENGKSRFRRIEFRREQFSRSDVIDLQTLATKSDSSPFALPGITSLASDGRLISVRNVPDSGGLDLFVTDKSGAAMRVTSTRGDDIQPSWAPGGRYAVFATARWDSLSHYDLAVLDATTFAVRQLTRGPYSDGSPHWSPEGTQIAFVRRSWNGAPDQLCFVTPAGSMKECSSEQAAAEMAVMGWFDSHRVVVRSYWRAAKQSAVVIYDVNESAWVTLRKYASVDAELSPDGRWILCRCGDAGKAPKTRLWAIEAPMMERIVRAGPVNDEPLELHWLGPIPHAPYLDSLTIDVPPAGIALNAPYKLTARGHDQNGATIDVRDISWSTPDTGVATVSAGGLLVPRRAGQVRVVGTAGGWRSTSATIEVAVHPSSTVLTIDWREPLERAFVPFGEPRPELTDDPRFGRAFWNRGDGSFTSGAYSRAAFDASSGLGLEAWISVPETMSQWQFIELELTASIDMDAVARWDHHTGSLPRRDELALRRCSAAAPPGEGPSLRNIVQNDGAMGIDDVLVPALSSGRWIRLRVQLFQDGRCGLAIDGIPRSITNGAHEPASAYRVVLNGNSFRTKVLVGPMEVWQGVRNDVDWRAPLASKSR